MKARFFAAWGILFSVFAAMASAHDLSASYATIRIQPERLELQVKIAAETAWFRVQATVPSAAGQIFVLEEFESVGRPALLKYASTMEELNVEGKTVAPSQTDVVVSDDNFVFTFTFPRPARGQARLSENYLKRMASDYVSRVVVVDPQEKVQASKTLHPTNPVFEFSVPPVEAAPSSKPTSAPTK
jgi:hypothetical protein